MAGCPPRLALLLVLASAAVCPAVAGAAEPSPTWVFFVDRDGTAADRASALAGRAAELSPRALQRRQRVRGDAGVDERDLDLSPGRVEQVLATGARLRARSRWLNAVSVVADESQLAAIRALDCVRTTRPVARRSRPPEPRVAGRDARPARTDYGLATAQMGMIGVPSLEECGLTGDGVVIAVQDTGFDLSLPALANVEVLAEHDFIDGDDVVGPELDDPEGQAHHGTSVLSLIAGYDDGSFVGVAPDAAVILSKTEDTTQEEPIEEDWFVEGLEWAEGLGADLFTASLGYFDWYEPEDLDGQTAVTSAACAVALDNGLILVNSAGNRGPEPSTLGAPADTDGLIAVAAVDLFGHVAQFSSRGPTADGRIKPDVAAPGVAVWTVDPTGEEDYRQGNGTSYAAPLVAGVAALLLQAYPELDPAGMHALLTSTAAAADAPDNEWGWGIVDGVAAAGLYCTCSDHDEDGWFDASCGGQDCDDFRAAVHPGADEICDGFDDDCDGELLDGEADEDTDGFLACDPDPALADCDDGDADSHPGASETPYDGVDQDCDGEDLVDVDGDGVPGPADDCDDEQPTVYPGADELCDDGLDNDCDGWIDRDDDACADDAGPYLVDDRACACRVDGTGTSAWAAAWLAGWGGWLARRGRRVRLDFLHFSRAGRAAVGRNAESRVRARARR